MKTPTEAIQDLNLTMETSFVPWSVSRNAGEKYPSLNYKVTILKNGKPFITTDYRMGCSYVPGYKQHDRSIDHNNMLKQACEAGVVISNPALILPKIEDVMYSLIMDSETLEYSSFEEWASCFGYDEDSREAERIYNQCLQTALKLHNTLGESALAELREVFQDY